MEPFIGEIKMLSFNWAPNGWALCNGATMTVAQNVGLFSLIGNQYGGDGKINFNLPDLRGQILLGQGKSTASSAIYSVGNKGGTETVTLTTKHIPSHTHTTNVVNSTGNFPVLNNNLFAVPGPFQANPTTVIYALRGNTTPVALNQTVVDNSGGGLPHTNMQPWAVTNYCIAIYGIYPSRQ
jgi:microcystin-dependent protein